MKISLAAAMALALAAATQSAMAATVSGHAALAMSALVGSYSTILPGHDKTVLARLLDGKAEGAASKASIVVAAHVVTCRAGNVEITAFACELTFGSRTVSLRGRRAHELFATIGEAGVPPDGAAGTIYAALHAMKCAIDPVAIDRKDGSGANCQFDPGPGP